MALAPFCVSANVTLLVFVSDPSAGEARPIQIPPTVPDAITRVRLWMEAVMVREPGGLEVRDANTNASHQGRWVTPCASLRLNRRKEGSHVLHARIRGGIVALCIGEEESPPDHHRR